MKKKDIKSGGTKRESSNKIFKRGELVSGKRYKRLTSPPNSVLRVFTFRLLLPLIICSKYNLINNLEYSVIYKNKEYLII